MELSATHYSLGKTALPGWSGWTLWKWSHNVVDRWVRDIIVPASDGKSTDSSQNIHGLSDACSWKAEISSSNLTGCLLHSLGVSDGTGFNRCVYMLPGCYSEDLQGKITRFPKYCKAHGIKSSICCLWIAAEKTKKQKRSSTIQCFPKS